MTTNDDRKLPVVIVTGSAGFIGWHTMCAFRSLGYDVIGLNRESTWRVDPSGEHQKILVHCAGVNRADETAILEGNRDAAERAVELIRQSSNWKHVLFVNSTQSEQHSPYGDAKSQSAHTLASNCRDLEIPFTNLIVPGVFGEFGRPNYNSFVATFAHQIVHGEKPTVVADNDVELIHSADLADQIVKLVSSNDSPNGPVRVVARKTSVGTVAELLVDLHRIYRSGVLPDLSNPFTTAMFNTLRSFMYPTCYPLALEPRSDNRGHLVETLKAQSGGQCFVSWTHPGITRGNHYHRRKFERFLVLEGEATIQIRRLLTDEVVTFTVSGKTPAPVDMPTLHTHNITNVGKSELITAFWTNEIFDPDKPDTYAELVVTPTATYTDR
jgi:UDP-2-acetamido-2,6-beta-L-arabino-hexul-4-ose reductase